MLTGADSSFGIPAVRLVRRAGKRKTLYVINSSLIAADELIAKLQFSNSSSFLPMFLCSVKSGRFFVPATFLIAMRAVAVKHG